MLKHPKQWNTRRLNCSTIPVLPESMQWKRLENDKCRFKKSFHRLSIVGTDVISRKGSRIRTLEKRMINAIASSTSQWRDSPANDDFTRDPTSSWNGSHDHACMRGARADWPARTALQRNGIEWPGFIFSSPLDSVLLSYWRWIRRGRRQQSWAISVIRRMVKTASETLWFITDR